ncbi:MAG: hypothetical protein ABR920_18235 [Terriglobales bacterium]
MKRLFWSGLLLAWLTLAQAMAQSPFDGTWKIDPNSYQLPTKPDVYLLQDGTYHCPTCDPPLEIRADGQDQKITAEACYDTVSVKVVDGRTIEETDKRNGKTVGTARMTVSSDGNTLTDDWTDSCNAKGDVVSGKQLLSRVAKGPGGSHAISGSWQALKDVSHSDNALVVTLKLEADTFTFADPTGQSYAARLDGTEALFKGGLENTTVSVKRIGENTIKQTDKRGGKTVGIVRFTISADRKSISVSMEDTVKGTTVHFVLRKQ